MPDFTVERLGVVLGRVIGDIDRSVTDPDVAESGDTCGYQAPFLRGQFLDVEEHLALAECFDEPWEAEPFAVFESGGQAAVERAEELFPAQSRSMVRGHARTEGPELYFLGQGREAFWMPRLVGFSEAKSDILLNRLRRPLDNADFQVRRKWSDGDVAISDETTTNDRGLADHYNVDPCRVRRQILVHSYDSRISYL